MAAAMLMAGAMVRPPASAQSTPTPTPPNTGVKLTALTVTPTQYTGLGVGTGTVTLNKATSSAVPIMLSSTRTDVAVPAYVLVLAGASTANFTVKVNQVSKTEIVYVGATLDRVTLRARVTLQPPPN
jgi:hypothetical protein